MILSHVLGGKKYGNKFLEGTKSKYSSELSITISVAAILLSSVSINISVAIKHHF